MFMSFHPQTDGQTEHANQDISQIFQTIVHYNQRNWVDRVDLTEFAINASISVTMGYALFELNGGHMPSREIHSDKVILRGIKDFTSQALQNLVNAHDVIIELRVFQVKNANTKHSDEPKIKAGDLVYLSIRNLNLSKGRAQKLCLKYVGPYKVLQVKPESLSCRWHYRNNRYTQRSMCRCCSLIKHWMMLCFWIGFILSPIISEPQMTLNGSLISSWGITRMEGSLNSRSAGVLGIWPGSCPCHARTWQLFTGILSCRASSALPSFPDDLEIWVL